MALHMSQNATPVVIVRPGSDVVNPNPREIITRSMMSRQTSVTLNIFHILNFTFRCTDIDRNRSANSFLSPIFAASFLPCDGFYGIFTVF